MNYSQGVIWAANPQNRVTTAHLGFEKGNDTAAAYRHVAAPCRMKRYNKLQSKREAAQNNELYTTVVHAFFHRLNSWQSSGNNSPLAPIHLVITSESAKDGAGPVIPSDHDRPAWEVRNNYKYINFKHGQGGRRAENHDQSALQAPTIANSNAHGAMDHITSCVRLGHP